MLSMYGLGMSYRDIAINIEQLPLLWCAVLFSTLLLALAELTKWRSIKVHRIKSGSLSSRMPVISAKTAAL